MLYMPWRNAWFKKYEKRHEQVKTESWYLQERELSYEESESSRLSGVQMTFKNASYSYLLYYNLS